MKSHKTKINIAMLVLSVIFMAPLVGPLIAASLQVPNVAFVYGPHGFSADSAVTFPLIAIIVFSTFPFLNYIIPKIPSQQTQKRIMIIAVVIFICIPAFFVPRPISKMTRQFVTQYMKNHHYQLCEKQRSYRMEFWCIDSK
ncbi:MAG: hypothetical protein V4735_00295 [Pseudomonadota bacterium]